MDPENLFGSFHSTFCPIFGQAFCGRFDSKGEPILVPRETSIEVPFATPHPGQEFDCTWIAHDPRSHVVVETGHHLLLALSCQARPLVPANLNGSRFLRVAANVVEDHAAGAKTVWEVCQYVYDPVEEYSEPQLITPRFQRATNVPTNEESLRVPLSKAIKFVGEEMLLVRRQRDALRLVPDCPLSSEAALFRAARDILGEPYRMTILHERIPIPLLHRLLRELGRDHHPDPWRQRTAPARAGYALWTPPAHDREGLIQTACHPTLIRVIADEAKEILYSHRCLDLHFKALEQQHSTWLNQHAKMLQPARRAWAPTSPQQQPNRLRIRF